MRLSNSLFFFLLLALSITTFAESEQDTNKIISTGIWVNYQYQTDPSDNSDRETLGTIGNEALILYFDHQASTSNWTLSAEFRLGPGAFTDPQNNSSGGNYLLHRAYLSYEFDSGDRIIMGKSPVAFAWKTINFWPGDMLLGAYGDQMDVGIQYQAALGHDVSAQLAYFHADDWGASSTDTADDNGHWGSSTSYRKVQTAVFDTRWQFNDVQLFGISAQTGLLQDLKEDAGLNPDYQEITGHHQAASIFYQATFKNTFTIKALATWVRRDLPDSLQQERIKNIRAGLSLSYQSRKWQFYIDGTAAKTKTEANPAGNAYAFAPGIKYDYGQGWFYFEYLQQNGDIDRNGDVSKGDFAAVYLTADYYFKL